MDEIESLTPAHEDEKARRKLNRRLVSMGVFLVVLVIPVGIGAFRVWRFYHSLQQEQILAEAELKKPQARPEVYGILGAIYLDRGRVAEALPLLTKAADLESALKQNTQDHLTLAKAHLVGSQKGVPGASVDLALKALQESLTLAQGLAVGRQAATYFSAGIFYRQLGHKNEALVALNQAVVLQPDDWVDEGHGVRYKKAGLSGYYQKMLAATQMD